MPELSFDALRGRLSQKLSESVPASEVDRLMDFAEGYVLFDALPEAPDPELPADLWSRPEDEASRLLEDSRSRLRARAAAELPLGASRFGGLPDLPPSLTWPEHDGRKLPLVAQIDFASLPHWEGSPLPADGWLYYFARFDAAQSFLTEVRYHAGSRSALVRASRPEFDEVWMDLDYDDDTSYPLKPLIARQGITINYDRLGTEFGNVFAVSLLEDELTKVNEAYRDGTCGWMLGNMVAIDGTAATAYGAGPDWIHLLAVQTYELIDLGDALLIYLLVNRHDLAARDFSRVGLNGGHA